METSPKHFEASDDLPSIILRHIRDSVIMTDTEGRVTFWNQGAVTLFGYSAEEMQGVSISRLYPTRNLNELKSHLDRLLTGQDFDGEWEGIRRDGGRIWLHTRRTVVKNTKREPIGFLGISKDITQQKNEQEAVRQSEQLYRAIGESINFGVWACDPRGRLTHLSDSFMKLLGLTAAQNLSDGWLNALHPDERPDIMEAWRECLQSGKAWSRRYKILGVDGRWHAVLTRAAPVRNEKGDIVCWAGLNLDIDQLQ